MRAISGYQRPADLSEALTLLSRPTVTSVLIGGGTLVAASALSPGTEVIDLQQAVAADIKRHDGKITFGGMTRIQDIVVDDLTPPLIAELAHREGPSTFRHAATVGGAIAAADWESELLAGLLVYEAAVTIARPDGATEIPLKGLLGDPGLLAAGIITTVSIAADGETASARTGRTPADTSIVAAVGRIVPGGLLVAVTGVAPTPILVEPGDPSSIDPPGDFRGSSEYRKELAAVLVGRVVARLGSAA